MFSKKKINFILLLFFCFSVLSGCLWRSKNIQWGEVIIMDRVIKVEVVNSLPDVLRGLSGRKFLPHDQGMLFVFSRSDVYDFWMKDMKIPLDIIWISNNQIVDFWPNAPIPANQNIPRYHPSSSAQYVLEVNAGTIEKYGWKKGNLVRINLDNKPYPVK